MRNLEFIKTVQPIAGQLTIEGDAYLFVHFSVSEDKFEAIHNNMDALDAMIVIKNLVKHFDIDPILLSTAVHEND